MYARLSDPLTGFFLRQCGIASFAMVTVGAVLAGMAISAQLMLGPIRVGPWASVVSIGLAGPALASVVVPASMMAAVTLVMADWRRGGALLAAWGSGRSGAGAGVGIVVFALTALAVTMVATNVVEPLAKRTVRRVVHADAASFALEPGMAVGISDAVVRVGRVDGQGFADAVVITRHFVASARRASVGADAVVFESGRMSQVENLGWSIDFDRWEVPFEPAMRRVDLDERVTHELAEKLNRADASDYEWSVLYKRVLHPFGAAFLVWAAAPIGASSRPWLGFGGAVVGYLVAVRLGDVVAQLGLPVLGAGLGPLFSLAVVGGLWGWWWHR